MLSSNSDIIVVFSPIARLKLREQIVHVKLALWIDHKSNFIIQKVAGTDIRVTTIEPDTTVNGSLEVNDIALIINAVTLPQHGRIREIVLVTNNQKSYQVIKNTFSRNLYYEIKKSDAFDFLV